MIDREFKKLIKLIYPELTTKRGIVNKCYEIMGLELVKDNEFINKEFLYNDEVAKTNWKKGVKASVLQQVGRIRDEYGEETALEVVKIISKDALKFDMSTKQWEQHLIKVRQKLKEIDFANI